ncbi:hypothetical protein V8C44DRAFT_350682 [Trichoderma aethiopicum]
MDISSSTSFLTPPFALGCCNISSSLLLSILPFSLSLSYLRQHILLRTYSCISGYRGYKALIRIYMAFYILLLLLYFLYSYSSSSSSAGVVHRPSFFFSLIAFMKGHDHCILLSTTRRLQSFPSKKLSCLGPDLLPFFFHSLSEKSHSRMHL